MKMMQIRSDDHAFLGRTNAVMALCRGKKLQTSRAGIALLFYKHPISTRALHKQCELGDQSLTSQIRATWEKGKIVEEEVLHQRINWWSCFTFSSAE